MCNKFQVSSTRVSLTRLDTARVIKIEEKEEEKEEEEEGKGKGRGRAFKVKPEKKIPQNCFN